MIYDDVNAYPLSWPATWPRKQWHERKRSSFAEHSLAVARDFVLDELRLLKAKNVIISTNVELRRDGLPRSGRRAPDDPGAAVYRSASLAEIQEAYRRRARETHPDAGGSQDDFVRVQAAFEAAKEEKGQ